MCLRNLKSIYNQIETFPRIHQRAVAWTVQPDSKISTIPLRKRKPKQNKTRGEKLHHTI